MLEEEEEEKGGKGKKEEAQEQEHKKHKNTKPYVEHFFPATQDSVCDFELEEPSYVWQRCKSSLERERERERGSRLGVN